MINGFRNKNSNFHFISHTFEFTNKIISMKCLFDSKMTDTFGVRSSHRNENLQILKHFNYPQMFQFYRLTVNEYPWLLKKVSRILRKKWNLISTILGNRKIRLEGKCLFDSWWIIEIAVKSASKKRKKHYHSAVLFACINFFADNDFSVKKIIQEANLFPLLKLTFEGYYNGRFNRWNCSIWLGKTNKPFYR